MKNRFVKSGLDLEAKMNELDQKAEKKKDLQDRTANLDKFLEELSADLLVMKNAVSLIDDNLSFIISYFFFHISSSCKHSLKYTL